MIYQNLNNANHLAAYSLSALLLIISCVLNLFIFDFYPSQTKDYLISIGYVMASLFMIIYLNRQLIHHKVIGVTNYLPQFIVTLFLLNISKTTDSFAMLLATLLMLVGTYKIINQYNLKGNLIQVFEIGLFLGAAATLHPAFGIALIFGILAITWLKTTSIKDYMAFLMGFFFPLFAVFCYRFLYDLSMVEFFANYTNYRLPSLNDFSFYQKIVLFILVIGLFIITITSYAELSAKVFKLRLHDRLWLWFLIFFSLSFLFHQSANLMDGILILFALPTAILSQDFLKKVKKKWIINAIFITFVFVPYIIKNVL